MARHYYRPVSGTVFVSVDHIPMVGRYRERVFMYLGGEGLVYQIDDKQNCSIPLTHTEFTAIEGAAMVGCGQPEEPAEGERGVYIKNKYKIHSLNVAQGRKSSARTEHFCRSLSGAESRAESIMQSDPRCEGIVIYKAIKVVRHQYAPTIIEDVEE